jgi:primosomal protein N' (replication factor Y)
VRFDSDSASGRTNAYAILRRFAACDYNLLLGTQMVTKGLDMPGVSLVGVLSADAELDLPDFRAAERTFAKLVQVAGRSGRTDNRGEVLIQTFYPDLALIGDAARQEYAGFFETEIASRREFLYPPFVRLANFVFSGADSSAVTRAAEKFRKRLEERAGRTDVKIRALGPVPCPLAYLKGQHRRHLLVKTRQIPRLVGLLSAWEAAEAAFRLPSAVKLTVDIDPVDMM